MDLIEKIPEKVKEAVYKNDNGKEILLYVCADLDDNENYCDVHIAVTEGKLHKIIFKDDYEFIDTYDKNDIDSLKVELMLATGRLLIQKDENLFPLCSFTTGKGRHIGAFEHLFKKAINNELTDEDKENDDIKNLADQFCPVCGSRYIEPERKICPKCMNKGSLFKRVLKYLTRYKAKTAAILVLITLSSVMSIISPFLTGSVLYDEVLTQGGKLYGMIFLLVMIIFIARVISYIFEILYAAIIGEVSSRLCYDIKKDVFSAMQNLSMNFFSSRQTGNLMTRVNSDVTHIQNFLVDGAPYVIINILQIIVIVSVLFYLNPIITLLVLIPVPVTILFFAKYLPTLYSYFDRSHFKNSDMNNLLSDALAGIRVVKAFSGEKEEIKRFDKTNNEVYSAEITLRNVTSTLFPFVNMFLSLGTFVIWGVGGYFVIKGTMSFGVLMTFSACTGMLYSPLQFLTEVFYWWSDCMNSAQRVFEIIDTAPEIAEKENAVSLKNINGEVEFKNVDFYYEPNKQILKDISFKVEAGKTLGIVGKTGAGKSTIVNLITRLYDTKGGSVYIDGHNVKDVKIQDLKDNVAIVSQEIFLFIGTIADNIKYAKSDATMDEVIAAAKAAFAHEFIMNLPDGYETFVGEGGRSLSGGERQRISIARAILKNPKILILDEATAAMDTETEKQIQKALNTLIEGRTTLMIAHRLSTLKDADSLIVIEHGKVKESGTHDELIKKKGEFYNLYKIQTEALKHIGITE